MTTDKVAQRREVAERLEAGVRAAAGSTEFKEYLQTAARFHSYSMCNVMLIHIQRRNATRVAGFKTWKGLGRYVKAGEKGIQIIAPRTVKRRDDDGNVPEADDAETFTYFVPVHVFDISQTDGKDLPGTITHELDGIDDAGLYSSLERLAWAQGLTVDRNPEDSSAANGYYQRDALKIWIKPDAGMVMATKTLAHELAHHFAEHQQNGHCRGEGETIAEASAYIVLEHFGIDSGDYSFGYLASWGDGETATFKAKLEEIVGTAGKIIDALS